MPQFSLYVQKTGDPTIFGVDSSGRFVAFESWQDLLNSNGGVAPQIQQRGAELQIPAGTTTSSGKPYVPAGSAQQQLSPTGDPLLDKVLTAIDQMIQDHASQGNMINPNIEITPEVAQQFLDQATNEISPYYQSQINTIKDDLQRSLSTMQQQYDLNKQQAEADFKQSLSNKRETLAGGGLAFSGVRGQQEGELASTASNTQAQNALTTTSRLQDLLSSANQTIGSNNLSGLTMPNLTGYQATTAGVGGFTPGDSLDLTMPTGTTGTLEYNQRGDIRSLTDFLKQQEIQRRTLNF